VREGLAMMAIVGVFTYEFSVTLPAFVKFSLGGSAAGLAYLMSAMGVGAAVGGLATAGRRGDGLGRLTVTSLCFGVSTALVGLSPNLETATLLMFFVGVFAARFTGLSNSILQLRSHPAMRSRVMALWSTAFIGSAFLGAPLLGWLAGAAGPRWSLGMGLVGGLIAGAIGWLGVRKSASTQHQRIMLAQQAEQDAA
jgi:MFS family permease